MFKNVKLLTSERVSLGNEQGWMITLEVENPKFEGKDAPGLLAMERVNLVHTIPDSAIVWRMAEHNLEDLATTLDILLTENYIQELNPPTSAEHIGRCAKKKLQMRLSTRSNKSTLAARAANPSDPLTAQQAAEPHPLDQLHQHYEQNPVPQEHLEACRQMAAHSRQMARRQQ